MIPWSNSVYGPLRVLLQLFRQFLIDDLLFCFQMFVVNWIRKDCILGNLEIFEEAVRLLSNFRLPLQNSIVVYRLTLLVYYIFVFLFRQRLINVDKMLGSV